MEMPVYMGKDEDWLKLRPFQEEEVKIILFDGKNPIEKVHELYSGTKFEFDDVPEGVDPHMHIYT